MTSVLFPNRAGPTQQGTTSAAQISKPQADNIFYPSECGKSVAKPYAHLYAMLTTLEVLKQFLMRKRGDGPCQPISLLLQRIPVAAGGS